MRRNLVCRFNVKANRLLSTGWILLWANNFFCKRNHFGKLPMFALIHLTTCNYKFLTRTHRSQPNRCNPCDRLKFIQKLFSRSTLHTLCRNHVNDCVSNVVWCELCLHFVALPLNNPIDTISILTKINGFRLKDFSIVVLMQCLQTQLIPSHGCHINNNLIDEDDQLRSQRYVPFICSNCSGFQAINATQ